MDPDIIFVSLKRHSMNFFDKVKKLSLISVYFYTQSARKYQFIILKNTNCEYIVNVFWQGKPHLVIV